MRRLQCVLLAGFLAVAGFVLPGDCASKRVRAPQGKPYVIGAMFAITGDAASLGVPERNTAQLLEQMINAKGGINGRPLKIVIEDTKGDPMEAVNAARRLIARDKVLAIVGPTRTGESLAVKEFAEKQQVPLVSCAAGIEIVEPVAKWVFKVPQSDRMAVQEIIAYLKTKKIKRVASLSDNSAFGKGGLREIQTLMPAAGIQVVAVEEYGPKDTTMATQLTKISSSKPQALVCWGTPPGPAIIAKEMRQQSMGIPLICSHGVANSTFISIAGAAGNGVVLPAGKLLIAEQVSARDPQRRVLLEYSRAYQKKFGKPADTFGGHAWDAIQVVVGAIKKVGTDRAKIRRTIENTKGFVGTAGTFNFSRTDHNGLGKGAFVMIELRDGKWRPVK